VSASTIPMCEAPQRHCETSARVSEFTPGTSFQEELANPVRVDFVSSPPSGHVPFPTPSAPSEPLLSLLTTSHPLLAKTIEGTTSAYNSSKNFSPRFKSSAEYVEGYLQPIGNTLGTVGRKTGVEGGVRWFLGAGRRQSSDLEAGRSKRRRRDGAGDKTPPAERAAMLLPTDDPYGFTKDRRMSMSTIDTLPAYDEQRSPAYTDVADDSSMDPALTRPTPWQTRVIMSTSGLSVAMSKESLRSLKYCLTWLKWANERVGAIIRALMEALRFFERRERDASALPSTETGGEGAADERSPHEIGVKIEELKKELLQTLREVIDTVSKYAGGALPENARDLVRRHLTSLPQRFRLASKTEPRPANDSQEAQDKDTREGAQKLLVLAHEGLNMMAQVHGVLDGTMHSAEEWCERLGRKSGDGQPVLAPDVEGKHAAEILRRASVDAEGDAIMR